VQAEQRGTLFRVRGEAVNGGIEPAHGGIEAGAEIERTTPGHIRKGGSCSRSKKGIGAVVSGMRAGEHAGMAQSHDRCTAT